MRQTRLFISYSRSDASEKAELERRLIERMPDWYGAHIESDEIIEGGKDWNGEIERMVCTCDIAILVISNEFFESDYILDKELPVLKTRLDDAPDPLEIYPIFLRRLKRPVPQWLMALQLAPGPDQPLGSMSPDDKNEEIENIVEQLTRRVYDRLRRESLHNELGRPKPDDVQRYADLELAFFHCDTHRYRVELRLSTSDNAKTNSVLPYEILLDPDSLLQGKEDKSRLGETLGGLVFDVGADALLGPDESKPADMLRQALQVSEQSELPLHLRICIDQSAQELRRLPWELLRYPPLDQPFSIHLDFRFSRYIAGGFSPSLQEVSLRRKPEEDERQKAVIFVPGTISGKDLVQVEYQFAALAICAVDSDQPVDVDIEQVTGTFEDLIERLKEDPVDILYIACDGHVRAGQSFLQIQNRGRPSTELGHNGVRKALSSILNLPRILILAPLAARIADPSTIGVSPWIDIASAFAEAGIPAVLVPQCSLPEAQWQDFLQRFFTTLISVDDADKAVCLARYQMHAKGEVWWAPVLFTRLKTARIWYCPGFRPKQGNPDKVWRELISALNDESLLPVIGAGLIRDIAGSREDIAQRWAYRTGFPLAMHERTNLPRVAQFVSVHVGGHWFIQKIKETLVQMIRDHHAHYIPELSEEDCPLESFRLVGRYQRDRNPLEPHRILSCLPIPVYLTTVWNDNLADALKNPAKGETRHPKNPEIRNFGEKLRGVGEDAPTQQQGLGDPALNPTPDNPLVLHLFGQIVDRNHVALTEDDYFSFLTDFGKLDDALITHVRRRLASSSLIFLGFKINQWDFRTLFHTIGSLQGAGLRQRWQHVAVQIDPDDESTTDPRLAQQYLEQLFQTNGLNIYWGKSEDFLGDLWERWQKEQTV